LSVTGWLLKLRPNQIAGLCEKWPQRGGNWRNNPKARAKALIGPGHV